MNPLISTSSSMQSKPRVLLGKHLIDQGFITKDQLQIALTEQKQKARLAPIALGKQLVQLGFVSDEIIRDTLAQSFGHQAIDLTQVIADAEALKLVPRDFARQHHVLPIAWQAEQRTLTIAIANISHLRITDQLRNLLGGGLHLNVRFASETQLAECIDTFYGYELSIDAILHELQSGEIDYLSIRNHSDSADEYSQPIVRLVSAIFIDAVKRGASDIHFEPEKAFMHIRYRIDGVLELVRSMHKVYWPGIAVRLKVISAMNIAESRVPQDGRFSFSVSGRPIDFRAATQPTIYGENIVLRILDRQKSVVPLEQLQLSAHNLATLQSFLARPNGMVLVTGPTGSGKTTTLYALLAQRNDASVNIMTLEDPVEYPVAQIRQTSINELSKMDFAQGIRAIMRQDPDIILIGEIRDGETAEMAFRAAMTGHQVFSTLHTNSALSVFSRLRDLGVPASAIAGNIIGVIAQRLIRRLCSLCKQCYSPSIDECMLLHIEFPSDITLYKENGCDHCNGKGYRGRMVIMELLSVNEDIDELIMSNLSMKQFRISVERKGFRSLAVDAMRCVLEGTTSIAEVHRVIGLDTNR